MRNAIKKNLLADHRTDISRCVRCGACSTVCPSFLADRRESRSPRGRMALIEAVLDGKLKVSDVYKDRLATCTGCMACESACASGVPFSLVIEAAKEQAVRESGPGIVAGIVSAALKRPVLMRSLAWLAPVALHYSGDAVKGNEARVRSAVRHDPHPCPSPLEGEGKRERGLFQRGVRSEKKSKQDTRGRVAFFPGCAVRYFQPDIEQATITVLEALGYEVIVPEGLQCCGRPYLSLGDREAAEKLAAKNADILSSLDVDAIVTSCASCGLTFKKEYPGLLDATGREQVRVLDIHEFLSGNLAGLELGAVNEQVTWHDPCHLGRGQGLSGLAREVLREIPGIELVEMKQPDRCCGFGGIMRLSHPTLSGTIGEAKARDIALTGASLAVTGCPGCRMQIADSLKRAASDIRVVHTVQVIAEALKIADCGFQIADLESTTEGKQGNKK
ncbi:MAG: (Fe-S)-binding protein [Nitrospirota bacterium]